MFLALASIRALIFHTVPRRIVRKKVRSDMGGAKTQYANAQRSQNKRLVSPIISSSSGGGGTEVVQGALRNPQIPANCAQFGIASDRTQLDCFRNGANEIIQSVCIFV